MCYFSSYEIEDWNACEPNSCGVLWLYHPRSKHKWAKGFPSRLLAWGSRWRQIYQMVEVITLVDEPDNMVSNLTYIFPAPWLRCSRGTFFFSPLTLPNIRFRLASSSQLWSFSSGNKSQWKDNLIVLIWILRLDDWPSKTSNRWEDKELPGKWGLAASTLDHGRDTSCIFRQPWSWVSIHRRKADIFYLGGWESPEYAYPVLFLLFHKLQSQSRSGILHGWQDWKRAIFWTYVLLRSNLRGVHDMCGFSRSGCRHHRCCR